MSGAVVLCALLLVTGCVSRNVERIDGEEAAAIPPPPAPEAGVTETAGAGAPATDSLSGVVELPAELAGRAPPNATLFLIVRIAGREGGAPLAVQRHQDPQFPLQFRITEQDAMVPGTPLVGDMTVTARVDQDGDAFTTTEGDLVAVFGPVQVGAADIRLTLAPAEVEAP